MCLISNVMFFERMDRTMTHGLVSANPNTASRGFGEAHPFVSSNAVVFRFTLPSDTLYF